MEKLNRKEGWVKGGISGFFFFSFSFLFFFFFFPSFFVFLFSLLPRFKSEGMEGFFV